MDFEITKREVLASVAIVCIMLAVGFLIAGNIDSALQDKYAEYNTALQINSDPTLFRYGMRTNVGNAFVYGNLTAVDPVSIKDIEGEYAYIKKQKQKYTMHTRVVTYTDDKGRTHTRTETYWTWDNAGSWSWHCNTIAYLESEFGYGAIMFPSADYMTTIYESGSVRYMYYVCSTEYVGTLYAKLADNTISNATFYNKVDIDSTIRYLESGYEKVIFLVLWILLTGGIVFLFYYIDNRWLE